MRHGVEYMFLCPVSRGALDPRMPEGPNADAVPHTPGRRDRRHALHAFCHTRDLVPGATRPGAPRRWGLGTRRLVRRAAACGPGGADGPRRHTSPGPAAVL